MDEQERREQDIDDALKRAAELHDETPDGSAELILTALDDEFVGSTIFPSAMGEIRREVERIVSTK